MTNRSLESIVRSMLSEATDQASVERKKIKNVARPDDAVDAQARTKQQEIQKKIIDEQEKTRMSDVKRFAELQGVSDDLIEAIKKVTNGNKPEDKMKGGKTQVDVNPVTKNPDVKEELKGKQHKLDKNKNGKLDAHDFKLLRKEEVEELDEISKKTAFSAYAGKANDDYSSDYGEKLHGMIKKKWGKKAGDDAEAHASAQHFGRGGKSHGTDKLSGIWNTSSDKMRTTKSGKIHKQDTKAKGTEIKSRLGSHKKPNLPEEIEMDEARGVAPGAVDKHNCATHVYHEQYGEGKPIYSQHAEPDAEGNIAWYDVMFEHGIEKQVMVNEMKILASESHGNHKKMKKEETEEVDEGVVKAAGSLLKHAVKVPAKAAGRVAMGAVNAVHGIAGGIKDTVKDVKDASKNVKKAYAEEVEEIDEADVASAQKAAQQKIKAAQVTAKATVQADKIKDQARKQAQMNSFEPEGNALVEAIKKMIKEPKNQVTSDSVKGVGSSDAGQTHLSDEYVEEGRKPKEPEEKPMGDEHPFAPRHADAKGHVTFKHKGKEYKDSVANYQKHRGHYMSAQGADRKDKVLHGYISSLGK